MNESAPRFSTGLSITFVTRLVQFFLGIGITVILARVLGPRGKGVYSLAILLPTLIMSFSDLGFGQSAVYFIGKKRYPPQHIFGNNMVLSLLLGIIGVICGGVVIIFFREVFFPGVEGKYLSLALVMVPLYLFTVFGNYLLLGLQRFKEYNFLIFFQKATFLILLVVFLFGLDFYIAGSIGAYLTSYLIAGVLLVHFVKKIIGPIIFAFDPRYIKEAFRYGGKVYLGNIICLLHYRIDLILINFFINPAAVGVYSIAAAIAERIWMVSKSAGLVLFPSVSSETDENRLAKLTPLVCRTILLVSALGALVLAVFGRLFISWLFSEEFIGSLQPFRVLLIGCVAMSGWQVLSNDIYGRGRPELNIYISLSSLVLNIVLNIIWIPRYGLMGAAIATSISYSIAFGMILVIYSKISRNAIHLSIFPQPSDFALYREAIKRLLRRLTMGGGSPG